MVSRVRILFAFHRFAWDVFESVYCHSRSLSLVRMGRGKKAVEVEEMFDTE